MRSGRRIVVSTLVVSAALVLVGNAAAAGEIKVSVDRTTISTALGHKFLFRSTISNRGSAPATDLIAHLNVLSLRDGVYIDPEDWSSNRTRYLAPIAAGTSVTITWKMQAVNSGSIGVYVAALERGSSQPPTTGPAVRVSIAEHKTLNSGGIVPLALGVPLALAALVLGVRLMRRREARADSASAPGNYRRRDAPP